MNKTEFIEWRSKQISHISRSTVGRWWQMKVRSFYAWVLK